MTTYHEVLASIKDAMSKDPNTPIRGDHCERCYRRTKCDLWMLPASQGEGALAPFVGGGLTAENAPEAILIVKAMEDAVDLAKGQLKTLARELGGIPDGKGKLWGPSTRNGRRSISVDKVESAGLLDTLEKAGCVSQGGTFEVFSWRSASSKKGVKGGSSEWKDEAK